MKDKITKLISETLNVENITPDSRLTEDLGADSLDFMELILKCEKEFNISISDEEIEKLTTVNNFYELLTNEGKND